MRSVLTKILAVVLLIAFLYSGWQLYQIYSGYTAAEEQYSALEQYVSVTPASPQKSTEASAAEPLLLPQVDFEALSQINSDIAGWLIIEGTKINYPIVQGEDNDFYLNHQFDGQYNSAGCLFLDAENNAGFQDPNQIVYGHYMKNKSMFYDLTNYRQQEFFASHPAGWLITPAATYKLHFFAGYVSDVSGEAWRKDFSETDHLAWLSDCKERSVFSSDVDLTPESRVLTLSTCSYEFENARFVLHGILEPQAEVNDSD